METAGRFASGSAQTPRPKVSFFVLSVGHLVKFRVCLSGGAQRRHLFKTSTRETLTPATFPKVNPNSTQTKKGRRNFHPLLGTCVLLI